jgi:hypothetical protein
VKVFEMDVSNANVFISGSGGQEVRGDLEDELEDWLGERAEISGGGVELEEGWWDIDLEMPGATASEDFVQELLEFLRTHGALPDVKVRVVEYIEREYRL